MSLNQSRQYRVVTRSMLCFGIALLIFAGSSGLPVTSARSRTRTIVLRGMNNIPATLIVNVGDTVVWKNEDIVPHTATDRRQSFDSGSIEPGGSWSYVAKRKGTYSYYCAFHPNTKGKLIVR